MLLNLECFMNVLYFFKYYVFDCEKDDVQLYYIYFMFVCKLII